LHIDESAARACCTDETVRCANLMYPDLNLRVRKTGLNPLPRGAYQTDFGHLLPKRRAVRLRRKIEKLEGTVRTVRKAEKLKALEVRLEALLDAKAKKQMLLAKIKWLELGDHGAADFWNLESHIPAS
jgi:hypothetical protein